MAIYLPPVTAETWPALPVVITTYSHWLLVSVVHRPTGSGYLPPVTAETWPALPVVITTHSLTVTHTIQRYLLRYYILTGGHSYHPALPFALLHTDSHSYHPVLPFALLHTH